MNLTREVVKSIEEQTSDTNNLLGNPPYVQIYAHLLRKLIEDWLDMELASHERIRVQDE
jgi:hypothetical protein